MGKKENKRGWHQLYLARPAVWKQLRKENRIDPIYEKKRQQIRRAIRLSAPFQKLQRTLYDKRINRIDLSGKPPVFILGHWRSGTTHLHYIMARDPRFAYLNNYQAFTFNISLIDRFALKWLMNTIMPKKRFQDNIKISTNDAAEEEQAFCMLSHRSGIHNFFFTKNTKYFDRYNLFRGISEEEKEAWKREYLYMLKATTLACGGRQLILKNPHNTSRVKMLLELFPDAKFVFIHRNPYDVFLSMRHLFLRTTSTQFLQYMTMPELNERIIYFFRETLHKYLSERTLIPKGNLAEVAFSDLEQDPHGVIKKIYEKANLGGYDGAKGPIHEYLESVRGYKKNKFRAVPEADMKRIHEEWGFFFDAFGYKKRGVSKQQDHLRAGSSY